MSIDFERARRMMVDNQLRTSGIIDRRLLAAMGEVPRERFVPPARRVLAYTDAPHPLTALRSLGPPAPFAKLVQLAAVEHTDRVLDVGCGGGYSSAVLARLAASVVGVEDDPALAADARRALAEIGASNAAVVEGDLERAAQSQGPFDVVVIEGTVPAVPEAYFDQLGAGGRLVALIAEHGKVPVAHLFAKSGQGIASRADFDARLPPLRPVQDDSFVF
ncbi:MAG TPA: protein-L-isoaspartate O-methyltransferase [Devosia sp.]|nr:protein-L-isoaspartate O-methyltransferase [Devosia sp.]